MFSAKLEETDKAHSCQQSCIISRPTIADWKVDSESQRFLVQSKAIADESCKEIRVETVSILRYDKVVLKL